MENKNIEELNKNTLNAEELDQVTGGGAVRPPRVNESRDVNGYTGDPMEPQGIVPPNSNHIA